MTEIVALDMCMLKVFIFLALDKLMLKIVSLYKCMDVGNCSFRFVHVDQKF